MVLFSIFATKKVHIEYGIPLIYMYIQENTK